MVESSFFDRVEATIHKHDMLRAGETVLVAVSGGPDSMVLLYLIRKLQPVLDLNVVVFHLNHQLRGREADEDARFVQEHAEKLGLQIIHERFDVLSLIDREKLSLEEAAREARYRTMEKVAGDIGVDKIALGHHADDQLETFLMRLLRGAGLEGLSSIRPVRGRYIRPLIEVGKEEILEYIEEHDLEYRIDASNEDLSILRNRIRHELVPLLNDYNPQLRGTLLNTIEIVSEDQAFIDKVTAGLFEEMAVKAPRLVRMPVAGLVKQPVSIQRRLVRQALKYVKGDLRGIEFKHVNAVIDSLRSGMNRIELELPGRLMISREYEYLAFGDKRLFEPVSLEEVEINVPGVTSIEELGIEIEAEFVELEGLRFERNGNVAHLDAAAVTGPLKVRLRKPGDAFRPYGMTGEKKLQDFFVDEKISKRERNRVPIIESSGKIAWVAGFRIDDSFKVTESTRRVLMLRLVHR